MDVSDMCRLRVKRVGKVKKAGKSLIFKEALGSGKNLR